MFKVGDQVKITCIDMPEIYPAVWDAGACGFKKSTKLKIGDTGIITKTRYSTFVVKVGDEEITMALRQLEKITVPEYKKGDEFVLKLDILLKCTDGNYINACENELVIYERKDNMNGAFIMNYRFKEVVIRTEFITYIGPAGTTAHKSAKIPSSESYKIGDRFVTNKDTRLTSDKHPSINVPKGSVVLYADDMTYSVVPFVTYKDKIYIAYLSDITFEGYHTDDEFIVNSEIIVESIRNGFVYKLRLLPKTLVRYNGKDEKINSHKFTYRGDEFILNLNSVTYLGPKGTATAKIKPQDKCKYKEGDMITFTEITPVDDLHPTTKPETYLHLGHGIQVEYVNEYSNYDIAQIIYKNKAYTASIKNTVKVTPTSVFSKDHNMFSFLFNWLVRKPCYIPFQLLNWAYVQPAKKSIKPIFSLAQWTIFLSTLAAIGYGGLYVYRNSDEVMTRVRNSIPSVSIDWGTYDEVTE